MTKEGKDWAGRGLWPTVRFVAESLAYWVWHFSLGLAQGHGSVRQRKSRNVSAFQYGKIISERNNI